VSAPDRELVPPAPLGEPYRADPSDPAPFQTTSQPKPEGAIGGLHGGRPGLPIGQEQPLSPPAPVARTPEQKFARTALGVGIASIFIFNLLLGPIAIVLGILAIRRGELETGRRAALFGALGILVGAIIIFLAAQGIIPSMDQLMKDLENRK
jgi:hypothetical protein